MSIETIYLQIKSKTIVLLFALICISCNRSTNQNEETNNYVVDTLKNEVRDRADFSCLTVQINDQVWMGENLCVRTFRNGDSIDCANSFQAWKKLTDEHNPAIFDVEIDADYYQKLIEGYTKNYLGRYHDGFLKAPDTPQYVLYNKYAVVDERILCPYGWRMPTKNDWNSLFSNVKDEKLLLDSVGVMETYGNSYGFSLRPTPYGFANGEYDFGLFFSIYWLSSTDKIVMQLFMLSDSLDTRVFGGWYPPNEYDGCCVRCIKE